MRLKAGHFLLFCFALLLVWLALGPVVRQVVASALNAVKLTHAARYVDSA